MSGITLTRRKETNYYFDGPHALFDVLHTLSSLYKWIDHRLAKKSNLGNQHQKTELGKRFVAAFRRSSGQMLTQKNLYRLEVQILAPAEELPQAALFWQKVTIWAMAEPGCAKSGKRSRR